MLEKLNPNCIAAQWEVRASMEMVVNSVSPSEFDSSAPPESSEINLQVLSFSLSVQIWIFNWPWLVWLNWISVNSLSSFFTKHPRKVPIEGGSISLRQNRTPKPMTSCCEWMLFNLFGPRFTPLARFICLWFSYCVCLLLIFFFFFWGKSVCLFFCWDINASHFSPFILSFFFAGRMFWGISILVHSTTYITGFASHSMLLHHLDCLVSAKQLALFPFSLMLLPNNSSLGWF